MKQIAIFASGAGSNAEKLIEHFNSDNNQIAKVSLIVSNKEQAGVLSIAAKHAIKTHVLNKEVFFNTDQTIRFLKENKIDLIILAGFLWLIPANLVKNYPKRIINIHPALLPKFGGKGMHGHHVHKAVKDMGEKETGITIHFVNEKYDEGEIIFQAKCMILENDSPEDIEKKVHQLEHTYFSGTIEKLILENFNLNVNS